MKEEVKESVHGSLKDYEGQQGIPDKTVKKELDHFCHTTSIKGVSKTANAKVISLRIMWLVVLLGGMAIGIWQLARITSLYFTYPTATSIRKEKLDIPFPDVTVCNLQPISSSTKNDTLIDLQNYFYEIDQEMLHYGIYERNELIADFIFDQLISIKGFAQNVEQEIFEELGHAYNSFIKSCSWTYKHEGLLGAGVSCSENQSISILDPNYVKCFTFSGSKLEKDVQKLKLVLYLDDFVNYVFPSYHSTRDQQIGKGVLLAIHAPDTIPETLQTLMVAPGHSAAVYLNPEVSLKLPDPYGNCTESTKVVYYADKNYTVTPESCVWDCMQEYTITKCGCLDIDLPVTKRQLEKYPYCGKLFETRAHQQAKDELIGRINCFFTLTYDKSSCQCDEPCEKYDYKPTINQIPWPHESYHLAFYEKVIANDETVSRQFEYYGKLYEAYYDEHENISNIAKMIYQSDLIERNYIELIIQFKSSEVTVLEEIKSLTWETLFGGVGGILNLWIGFNIVAIFELVELIYKLIIACFSGYNNRNQVIDIK